MRTFFLIALIFSQLSFSGAQTRFINADYGDYFDWFHERSQITELYTYGSTLYVFETNVKVYQKPDFQAPAIAVLTQGQSVTSLSDYTSSYYAPEGDYNGYGDLWYRVKGIDAGGRTFQGYVFGVFLAKGWRHVNLVGNRQPELIMLGVSTRPRKKPEDINAEIRIMEDGHLVHQMTVPGLCLFEDCGSSALLRIIKDNPYQGMVIIEASTMAVGCFAGIEKSFFHWDGRRLERVFQAEFTTGQQYLNKPFTFLADDQTTVACKYSHEDRFYNPVWTTTVTKNAPRAGRAATPKAVPVRAK